MSKIKTQEVNKFFDNDNYNSGKKYVRKKRDPYKLYIPENLDIDEILKSNPPSFKYHRDCFVYILHLITSIPARKKDFDIEKSKGFTPIHKKYLSARIHRYRAYIDYLKQEGVVIEGTSYKPKYYACGLKFSEVYRTKITGCYITKNTLIKSITERLDNRDVDAERRLSFLKKWYNHDLRIDMEGVKKFLEEDAERDQIKMRQGHGLQKSQNNSEMSIDDVVTYKYNMRMIPADKINEGKGYRLKIDNTSGRFHSPLTNLTKGLKQFTSYCNQELYGIDIVNSQPLLSMILLGWKFR